jgi:hypothetical protein
MGNSQSIIKKFKHKLNSAQIQYKKGNKDKAALLFLQGERECKKEAEKNFYDFMKFNSDIDQDGRKKILEDMYAPCKLFVHSNFTFEMKKHYSY